MRTRRLLFSLIISSVLLVSCAPPLDQPQSKGTPEPGYCIPTTPPASSMTFSGKAYYRAREPFADGTGSGLGAAGTKSPIRFAEVRVYQSKAIPHKGKKNELVQCGETDANGAFSLKLPKASGAFFVEVNSRANNSKVKASVLNNPTDNKYFSLVFHIAATGVDVALDDNALVAPYKGSLEGGAFNILDQIYLSNEYLRNKTASHSCTGCKATFTVAPKVNIYWTPGFDPGSYYGIGPLSFYIPSQDSLYILGGKNGDVNYADTDHFDNSIIIHEYGHFIEDQYAKTDSPGGPHNGDSIIDPRLAWGEGWADFFQAAVTGEPGYFDTAGNIEGETSLIFSEDLETPEQDIATEPGEGNFREFSIARVLWDLIDSNDEGGAYAEVSELDFAYLWEVFTDSTTGFRSSNVFYRNVGHFYELLIDLVTNNGTAQQLTDLQTVLTNEKHADSRKDYASVVVKKAGCTTDTTMIPDFSDNGSFGSSNQFRSNDFFVYHHPGGAFNLKLIYSQVAGVSSVPTDLDLFVYPHKYKFDSDFSDLVAYSEGDWGTDENGEESITLADQAKGHYMINVKAYTQSSEGQDVSYRLEVDETRLCP